MSPTRFERLELLRKALIIATKQLFPEITGNCTVAVELHVHQSPKELLDLAREAGFEDDSGDDGTVNWVVYPATSRDGDVTFFEAR